MTRQVVSVREVASRWARNWTGDQARSPGRNPSASFVGRDLYCYHMLIARWHSPSVVLATHNHAAPSQTTKQHLYQALRMLPHDTRVYRVDPVDANPEVHLKYLRERYDEVVKMLEKSRNPGTASYRFDEIIRMGKELRAFALEFWVDLEDFVEHTPSPRVLTLIIAGK